MGIKISAIDYYLPKKIITNDDLKKKNPDWNMESVAIKSGVTQRHIARKNETALDLTVEACKNLLKNDTNLFNDINALIFCTQSPDYIMPPNAYLLQKRLRLPQNIIAFDFNLACSGYIYSIAMSHALIESKLATKILLVNADTYSKYISKNDRSTSVLFGDAAAVTIVEKDENARGVIDVDFLSDGFNYDCFYIPAGGCRLPKSELTNEKKQASKDNIRTNNDIYMDGMSVWAAINSKVPKQIKDLIKRNDLSLNDIDQFFFHQASQMTLNSLKKVLGIDNNLFINLEDKGNTVSASIPIAMKDALENEKLNRGDLLLLSGFGVGMSYAAMLIEY
tara:strand:+ start:417 stop:1424 length:1008 start_codon:yes stop_codon:yes gene_type:complete